MQSDDAALIWLRKSAVGGNAVAMTDLGKGINIASEMGVQSSTISQSYPTLTPSPARNATAQDWRDFDNAVRAINNTGTAFNSNCPASNPNC